MKVLVFGAGGQLGRALCEAAQRRGHTVFGLSHQATDICDAGAVRAALRQHRPTGIVNAAAYAAVDRAEEEPEAAFRVNRDGARVLAENAAEADTPLIHISTDYVFDGKGRAPYTEADPVAPEGVYARSKEEGERAVRATAPKHVILRTSWIYSPFGTNFLRTMLRLGAEKNELKIVNDQTGCPTSAADVAEASLAILAMADPGFTSWGTYHYAGADAVTWYGFAKAIFDEAAKFGLVAPELQPVTTADVPRPAPRPVYSVLSTAKLERVFGIKPRPLQESLAECLERLLAKREETA